MGVKERRERDKAEMRARIMDAATQLFVEQGVPNVSIRKIADRIEYSPATIYLYFRDKEQLLAAVCSETFSKLRTGLAEIMREAKDPVAALRRGLRCYIDFGIEHPHHYMLTFNTPHEQYHQAEGTPEFCQANETGLETFDVLRTSLKLCRDSGALDFEDLEAASQSVWTFIHGTTSLVILFHRDPYFPWVERERLIENSLDIILKGLGAKSGKQGRRNGRNV